MTMRRIVFGLATLLATGWMQLVSAATYTWTGEGAQTDGVYTWNDANNWGGVGYPTTGDIAQLPTDGAAIALPSAGVSLQRIYATAGTWRLTGGTLTLTDAGPFCTGAGKFDTRVGVITFDCPVNFSSTADKTILAGNIFNNTVTMGTPGRAFFPKGEVAGASGLVVFSGNRVYDFTANNNICVGMNNGVDARGGEMLIKDGATVNTKIFFDFSGSVVTVTNGTLTTSAGGTGQSLDMVRGAALNVLAGGTVTCAGRLTLGQGTSEEGDPQVNVIGGTLRANFMCIQKKGTSTPRITIDQGGVINVTGDFNYNNGSSSTALNIGKGTLTVGGTMLQGGSQTIFYTVPADQELGTITVGTMKHTSTDNTVNIRITDDTLANGKTYVLLTDKSKTLGLADYTVLYNGEPATAKGTLKIEEGVLTFQPTPSAIVWTGAGDGVHFSDGRNWSTGAAPTSGSSIYFTLSSGGALVNDLTGLSFLRLQFNAGAGAFTISGNPIIADGAIVSRTTETQTLACVVTTPEGKNLYTDFSLAPVVFSGGVTALDIQATDNLSRTLYGTFTLTRTQPEGNNDNDYWSTVTYTVKAGSTLNIPGEIFVRDGQGNPKFVIEEGATMNVGTYRCRSSFETFDVKGTLNADVLWGFGFSPVFTTATSTGVVNVRAIYVSANTVHTLRGARFNLGAGGVSGFGTSLISAGDVSYLAFSEGVTVGATADWTLYTPTNSPKFKIDVPGRATLDTDGHVVSFKAPLTGEGTLALSDDTIVDLSYIAETVQLAPVAGATIRTLPALTKKVPLVAPASGTVTIELLTADGIPAGSAFTLFTGTGLTVFDAERFAVTVPGQSDVRGTVSITGDGSFIFTVTESDTPAATLLWRPTSAEEAGSWSTEVTAWIDAATSGRTPFLGFSNATFDGTESVHSDTVAVDADVNVGTLTVTGEQNYTLTGTGRLLGKGKITKDGSGTLTLDGPSLTDQTEIEIKGGTVVLGTNLTANALGTAGTNMTITITDGGQLDLNYPYDTGADATRSTFTANKTFRIEGAGPDGEGAIVNRGGGTSWCCQLGRVELTGDTTFGGISRVEFRTGTVASITNRPYLKGPRYTVTSKVVPVGGNYGLHFNTTDVDVGSLVVDENAAIGLEGALFLNVPGGIILSNGAHVDAYGNTVAGGETTAFMTKEGATAALRNMNATATIELPIAVVPDSSLAVNGTMNLNQPIVNEGSVVFTNGTKYIYGPLRGEGDWTVSTGTTFLRTSAVPEQFDWTVENGGILQLLGEVQLPAMDVTLTGDGTFYLGNYETTANPVVKSVTATGNMSFHTFHAISQTLPPLTVVNTNRYFCTYTDNIETRVDFPDGHVEADTFFVGGASRGGHFTSGPNAFISANLFHIGNQGYAAPRALYEMNGSTLEIGANGMASQYAPLGTFAVFNGGTIRAKADFSTGWGFCGIFGNDTSAPPLVFDVGDHTVYYRSGLGGKGVVNVKGDGCFFTTKPFQNADLYQDYAEGKWYANATTNDFSGASAFGNGLEVGAGKFARLCIRNEELCEFSHYGTTDYNALANTQAPAWQIANNMNHLNAKLADTAAPYHNHTFVYRGQFYVEEDGGWTFAGTYDDRIVFTVDDSRVFETTASGEVKYGNVQLTAGWHKYKIVIEDNTGNQGPTAWSGVALGWTNAVISSTAQADYRPFCLGNADCGLKFRLANSLQWERKKMVRQEDMTGIPNETGFETLTVTNTLRQIGVKNAAWPDGQMALNRFSGSFYVPAEQAGSWQFWSGYDDWVSLRVDGVDSGMNGRTDGVQTAPVVYTLDEGWHELEIRVYDRGGDWCPRKGDAALWVTITPNGGSALAEMTFDERNFRFCRLTKPSRAGLDGTVTLHEGSILANGGSGYCPIWGTLEGNGTLAGPYRFKGATWRIAGDSHKLDPVTFTGYGTVESYPETLAELGAIDLEFSAKPVMPKYDVSEALGLTAETAAAIPVTVHYPGQGTRPSAFKATVEDGRLVLLNANPGGLVFILR